MTTIPTEAATVTITSDPGVNSKLLWLAVEHTYTNGKARTRLTPTQAVQLAQALLNHALRIQGIPT